MDPELSPPTAPDWFESISGVLDPWPVLNHILTFPDPPTTLVKNFWFKMACTQTHQNLTCPRCCWKCFNMFNFFIANVLYQIYLVPNYLFLTLGAKLSILLCWCQIVCFELLVPNCLVPNCPVQNCPTIVPRYSTCRILIVTSLQTATN